MAIIRVAVIRYEHQELVFGAKGATIGQQVDLFVFDQMEKGEQIQSVTVDFDPLSESQKLYDYHVATQDDMRRLKGMLSSEKARPVKG